MEMMAFEEFDRPVIPPGPYEKADFTRKRLIVARYDGPVFFKERQPLFDGYPGGLGQLVPLRVNPCVHGISGQGLVVTGDGLRQVAVQARIGQPQVAVDDGIIRVKNGRRLPGFDGCFGLMVEKKIPQVVWRARVPGIQPPRPAQDFGRFHLKDASLSAPSLWQKYPSQ